MCVLISIPRLIFPNEQICTQENTVNLHIVGGVPNTSHDDRGILIGPFKYMSLFVTVLRTSFFLSRKSNLCTVLTTQKQQKTCTVAREKHDCTSAQCAFECKNVGYWSQAKDGWFSSAQTLPRSPTNSAVTICNYCVSREVSSPEPFNLRHFLFLILHYFYCVFGALRKKA